MISTPDNGAVGKRDKPEKIPVPPSSTKATSQIHREGLMARIP
jgi:hypothetical protein